ncbi:ribonuclease H2, subunit B [Xylariaceae sp. FL1272]|nr:ribonuclease H2, subunit B [Xylariaceae sp. FL1272]
MARTRATKGADTSAAEKSSTTTTVSASKHILSPPSQNPPKIFILPKKATSSAKIVSLLHPRYSKPTRYLVCPETGSYEFTRIAAPKSTPRSWLIHRPESDTESETKTGQDTEEFNTYTTSSAELFIATPIDPVFLILPTLIDPPKTEKRKYISSDDHFDRIQESSPHLWEILQWGEGSIRRLLEDRLAAVCDTVTAGDERMYKFNESKLFAVMLEKASRMGKNPLPASMEEKFVTQVLEAPLTGKKVTTSTTVIVTEGEPDETQTEEGPRSGTVTPKPEVESQSSVSSTDTNASFTSVTSVSTTITEPEAPDSVVLQPAMIASAEVTSLQRLRVAFQFLCSSYIPTALSKPLLTSLTSSSSLDFSPLNTYLSSLQELKASAQGPIDYGRKRVLDDDEAAERAEKKRKKDEEEKRKKAGESMAVKQLRKVNVSGMKKMSDFFKKKT